MEQRATRLHASSTTRRKLLVVGNGMVGQRGVRFRCSLTQEQEAKERRGYSDALAQTVARAQAEVVADAA